MLKVVQSRTPKKGIISKERAPGGLIYCNFPNCKHAPFPNKSNKKRHELCCDFRPIIPVGTVQGPALENKKVQLVETYIQDKPCSDYPLKKIMMCNGCKGGTPECKFRLSRKLRKMIVVEGFLDPESGPMQMDRDIWIKGIGKLLPLETAKDIIRECREVFSEIIKGEEDALNLYTECNESNVIWKNANHHRRICNQCSTSIFDRHWVCQDCMISLCIDCYKDEKKEGEGIIEEIYSCCNTNVPHLLQNFRLAQLSPANCLEDLKRELNNISELETEESESTDGFKRFIKECEPCFYYNIDFNSEITPTTLYDSFSEECPLYDVLGHGEKVSGVGIQQFWAGFVSYEKRVRQKDGTPYVLQLKDFPKNVDLKASNPKLFQLFMRKLPIQEYMRRDGDYNLAALLPPSFKPPQLGPKFYVAYACPEIKKDVVTTQLHMDISDVVNINVFVSVPPDWPQAYHEGVIKIMEDWGVDIGQVTERMKSGAMPGALWIIFHPSDSQKMNQVLSNGKKNEHPIHNQCVSITKKERQLLAKNDIFPYVYVQFQGDAVVIPAGAPHQVKNLGDCIKMAEDFVSPESLGQCLKITQQLRRLPIYCENHADKLQAKAIAYHSMRAAVSSFNYHKSK